MQALVIENMEQPLPIAVLAAEVQLSSYHFARSFKATCGLTPHQFVLQQRMKRARKLMLESSDSIADIALRVGFGTASHFLRRSANTGAPRPRNLDNSTERHPNAGAYLRQ